MSQINANAILDASGGTTASINGHTPSASNMTGRNRLINSAMMIDQRNAGASVTTSALQDLTFTLDRWGYYNDVASCRTIQQSSDAPAGFSKSLLVTIISTDNTGPQQYLKQSIEGLNVADFNWGTASASTATLSFWVKSSVTGQMGGSLQNSGASRSYPFAYTINSANTWEKKTISISGDTSGTWLTTNGIGITVLFENGVGYQKATAGAWVSSNSTSSTGSVNLCATNGATWYITGVQLEVGSSASEFEHRQYGQELALCQRYAIKIGGGTSNNPHIAFGTGGNTTTALLFYYPPVTFRSTPSLASFSSLVIDDSNGSISISGLVLDTNGSSPAFIRLNATATGLTQFRPYFLRGTSSTGNLVLSAEL